MAFGPDGNLYVVSPGTAEILRYQGPSAPAPGAFMGAFVAQGSGGLVQPASLTFGPDGNLYVSDIGGFDIHSVKRYEGPAGPNPGAFMDVFVTPDALQQGAPDDLAFGPDGNLYVSRPSSGAGSAGDIFRFQGPFGAAPGAFIDVFVPAGSGGGLNLTNLLFHPGPGFTSGVISFMLTQISEQVADGGTASSLSASLNNALQILNRFEKVAGIEPSPWMAARGILGAFLNKLDAFLKAGRITLEVRDTLREQTNNLLSAL